MPNIKIRLKSGPHEIEAEGSTTDVETFLGRYWSPNGSSADDPQEEDDFDEGGRKPSQNNRTKPRARKRNKTETAGDDSGFDANTLANEIKEHKLFAAIDKKIIHAKGILFRKASLVLWVSKEALSSGQIQNVLLALGVKVDQGNLSNALKDNINSLMPDKARSTGKARYRLTTPATTEFETWLKKADE